MKNSSLIGDIAKRPGEREMAVKYSCPPSLGRTYSEADATVPDRDQVVLLAKTAE
jgi:hypothetical protein